MCAQSPPVVPWHSQFSHGAADGVLLSSRGVVRVDVNLQDIDIDQCSADGWFAGTHRCNLTTMEVSAPDVRIGQGLIYSVKVNCNAHLRQAVNGKAVNLYVL